MDLSNVPAEVAPWIAVPASLFLLWKLAGEGIKSWRDARQVGRAPATPYEALAARVVALEEGASEKADRLDLLERSVRRLAGVLTREVSAVLAWIAGGARPPAPDHDIALIRSVIADLEHQKKDRP